MLGLVPSKEEIPEECSLSVCEDTKKKVVVCKPGRVLSLEIKHAGTLILCFQFLELGENTFLFFNLPNGILLWQPEQTEICR